jgi:hypothetical protein
MTPEVALTVVSAYCESRVPDDLRDELRYECSSRGGGITISEHRPPWNPELGSDWTELKVAQLRYDASEGTWSLYGRLSSDRWFQYDDVAPAPTVVPLLEELTADPTGIFWG